MAKSFGLQWHLTNECDQRCQHCYIWQKHEKEGLKAVPSMTECKRVIENFIAFCNDLGVSPYFSITGGDPLLYAGFWDVVEALCLKKLPFTILGNPYHITPTIAQRLKESGCVSYQMSLDGMEKTHDEMRKKGSFKATLAAIPNLHDAGIRSMIMSTVSLLNYKEIPDVARVCVENNVGNFAFSRYCPTRADTQFNIPPTLYREFLETMWSVYQELIDRVTNFALKDHLWVAFLYEKGLYQLTNRQDVILDGCNCGIKHMTLLPNGTVYACRRFDSLVGNIREKNFKDMFFSPEMEKFRDIKNLEGCSNCVLLNYCRGCHAVAAGTTGNFFSKDPQCWRI